MKSISVKYRKYLSLVLEGLGAGSICNYGSFTKLLMTNVVIRSFVVDDYLSPKGTQKIKLK